MSYADQAALAADFAFQQRLAAALASESKPKTDDLAQQILRNPMFGQQMFMPFIASEPGFDTPEGSSGIDDAQMLSAIQANWDRVAALYPPAG